MPGRPGRPKGYPKTGGRQKGTPNKRSQDLVLALAEMGCDPVEVLARFVKSEKAKPELRVLAAKELLQYLYPKRRAVEHSGSVGLPDAEERRRRVEEILAEAAGTSTKVQ